VYFTNDTICIEGELSEVLAVLDALGLTVKHQEQAVVVDGFVVPDYILKDVKTYLISDKKIQAIKRLREASSLMENAQRREEKHGAMGLREAKDFVDDMATKLKN
jgi:ribosomal protein L7/L12